jgi:WD40 repeat protein
MTNPRDDVARTTLSPDGRRVAVVSSRAIQILDARTLEPIASVAKTGGEDHEDIEISFANDKTAFSPDGKRLLVVPGSRMLEPYIYDLATSKSQTLPYGDEFHDLAVGAEFSPNGKTFLIAHHNGWVELRDAASGRLIRSLGKRDSLVSNVESFFTVLHHASFSPGSDKVLLAYSGGWVEIWDATRGRRLQTAGRRPAETDQQQVWKFPLSFAVFSPDGKSIAMNGKDGGVTIWNATDGKPVATYSKDVVIGAAAFSNDGKLLAAGGDNGIASIFNLEGSPLRAQLVGHAARITGVRFSNDGETVLTSSADGTIKNWSVDRAFDVAALPADSPQAYGVSSLERRPVGPLRMTLSSEDGDFIDSPLTRDGVHVVTTERHQVKLWNTRRGSADRRWFFSPEQRIEVAADGNRLVLFGGQRAASVLDLSQAGLKTRATLAVPAGTIRAVRIPGHDESVVVLMDTGCLALLDAKTGRLLRRVNVPVEPRTHRLETSAGALAVSDDGAYAAVETGGKGIAVYALKMGQIIKTLNARGEDAARFLEFVDRNTILSVGGLGHYLIFKIDDGSVKRYPLDANEAVDEAGVSPDGRFLVTDSDQMLVKLRELETGTVRWSAMAPETGVTQLRFSPDGRNIIAGSKFFGVTIRDAETGLIMSEISHDRFANALSANYPGPAGLQNWDSFLGSKVIAMWGAEGKTALTFSPGVVQEWDLRPLFDGSLQQRIARACRTLLAAGARAYRQNELARPVLRRRAPGDTDPCNDEGPSTWGWWTRW